MGATALVFPGQGSQRAGMREAVERVRPHLLELSTRYVGEDPFEHHRAGPRFLQPAIYCASIAYWVEAGAPAADYVAAHSVGELAALVAAGSLSAEDGLRLVATRGRAMQQAAESHPDGGMLALECGAEEAARTASRFGVTVANDNADDQVVLSGERTALAEIRREAHAHGLRAAMLPIKGAMHSPAMEPAVGAFRQAIAEVDFASPRVPVFSGVTARPFEDIPRRLVESISRRVRWRETVLELASLGVDRFLEVGPGDVLTRLIRRTLPQAHAEALSLAPGPLTSTACQQSKKSKRHSRTSSTPSSGSTSSSSASSTRSRSTAATSTSPSR